MVRPVADRVPPQEEEWELYGHPQGDDLPALQCVHAGPLLSPGERVRVVRKEALEEVAAKADERAELLAMTAARVSVLEGERDRYREATDRLIEAVCLFLTHCIDARSLEREARKAREVLSGEGTAE